MENVGCMAFTREITSIALFFLLSGSLLLADDTDTVDFAHEIVPILQRHCVECHGRDEAEGGFSINNRRLFLEGEAAIPGDADESLFIELIEDPILNTGCPPRKPRARGGGGIAETLGERRNGMGNGLRVWGTGLPSPATSASQSCRPQ